MTRRDGEARLRGPLSVSLLLHLSLVALVIWMFRQGQPIVMPPVYKVNIVAAPPGPRAVGEVTSHPLPPAKPTQEPSAMREVAPHAPVAPSKKAPVSTPVTKATPTQARAKSKPKTPASGVGSKAVPKAVPKAGGGPKGGHGSDVATVQTEGIDFPFPGYLNNIVRQIALNFKPADPNAALRAEVAFLIHRDGSVSNFRFISRSGVYAFDLGAQGAVEKASSAFGPLPDGFREDVLPVVFTFDPQFLR